MPRGGETVERILGLYQGQAQSLQDIGFTHISFYIGAEHFDEAVKQLTRAGGQPISEPHANTKYEDKEGNCTVYVKSPWGSLIELQTVPNGFYYPDDSEAAVFVPKKLDD